MSVCGQTEEDSASEEAGGAVREIYQQKSVSKVVRVLTVLAYLLSVSLAAILLSVYYICVWKSPELPPLNDTEGEMSARRGHLVADTDPVLSFYRRGNSTVNEAATPPPPPLDATTSELPGTGSGSAPLASASPGAGFGTLSDAGSGIASGAGSGILSDAGSGTLSASELPATTPHDSASGDVGVPNATDDT